MAQNGTAMKGAEKATQRYKIGTRKWNSGTEKMPRMKKKRSYATEINFCAAKQIGGNNRTDQTNEFTEWRRILRGNNYIPRTNKEYYAATIIYRGPIKNITRQQLFCRGISEKCGIKMIMQQN
jgi:hypothetical protein